MTRTDLPHLPAPILFGRRLIRPLTAAEKAAAAIVDVEANRAAMRARTQAYSEARWEEDLASLQASIRAAEGAIARRRLAATGGRVLQSLVGFAFGLSR